MPFPGGQWPKGVSLTCFPWLKVRVDEDPLDLHHFPLLAGIACGAVCCGGQLWGRARALGRGCRLLCQGQAAAIQWGLWCIPIELPEVPLAAPTWFPSQQSCLCLLLAWLGGWSIPELMAALPLSAPPLLPTAPVPLSVPLGCPTDTGGLLSLARHGAAGLGVEAELLEPCPQHLSSLVSFTGTPRPFQAALHGQGGGSSLRAWAP